MVSRTNKTIKMKLTDYELEDVKSWDYPDTRMDRKQ